MRQSSMHDAADLLQHRRLFVFDLDGTLADSSPAHAAAFAAVFDPLGVTIDYAAIAGLSTEAAVAALLTGAGRDAAPATIAQLAMAKRTAARERLSRVVEMPGARDFVAAAARHHRCALFTSASAATAATTLAAIGLGDAFDPVLTATDVARAKPAPDGLLHILAQTGVSAREALVFEDSAVGLAAAEAAGIDAVAIGPAAATWPTLTRALERATA